MIDPADLIALREYLSIARSALLELADRMDAKQSHECSYKLRAHAKRCNVLRAQLQQLSKPSTKRSNPVA